MKTTKKKYKLKNKYRIIFIVIIILIISLFACLYIQYRLSNTYKFKELGYNKNEITYLISLDENIQNKLISLDYDPELVKLLKQKYFIKENFDKYLKYMDNHKKINLKNVVVLVNVGRNEEYYKKVVETNVSKNELMLVNKYNYLSKTYTPKDVVDVSILYSYEGRKASKEILKKYQSMYLDAKKENIHLIINSGYRSYQSQEEVYNESANSNGEDYADDYAAHPGFSEHQSGYAFDLGKLGVSLEEFEKTDEFTWLKNNAYKYGFILRYPKGKENITGFKYESWHYRYVGKEVAKKIYKENITFDEYYAFYIKK